MTSDRPTNRDAVGGAVVPPVTTVTLVAHEASTVGWDGFLRMAVFSRALCEAHGRELSATTTYYEPIE